MAFNENFSFITDHIKELELIEAQVNQQSDLLSKLKTSLNNTDENITAFLDKASSIVENNTQTLTNLKDYWKETSSKIEKSLGCIEASAQNEIDKNHEITKIKEIIDNYNDIFRSKKQTINDNTTLLLNLIDEENFTNLEFNKSKIVSNNLVENQNIVDNDVLTISEKLQQVFLPYTKFELEKYLNQFPQKYSSFQDVINQEFIYPLSYYTRHSNFARFRECYSLIRDKEGKSVFDALKYAFEFMFRYEINPAIIAACKTQSQFEAYLDALEKNTLDDFKDFKIVFNVSPNAIV